MQSPRINLCVLALTGGLLFATAPAPTQAIIYVDDDASSDPGPGDPAVSDPLEDGSAAHPFDAIQDGIDASSGDEVVVLDGTYTGAGNKNLDFGGRAITVRSENGPESTIIDCENDGRAFYFHSGETEVSVLNGFTLRNGNVYDSGGGIYCDFSSPTIINYTISGNSADEGGGMGNTWSSVTVSNCVFHGNTGHNGGGLHNGLGSEATLTNCAFSDNSAHRGGGMYNDVYSTLTLTNCIFSGNSANSVGGGMVLIHSSTRLANCIFSGNWGGSKGGGMFSDYSFPTLTNCTFAGNSALYGRAIACDFIWEPWFGSTIRVTNSILWDGGGEVRNYDYSEIFITYSDVQGGASGLTDEGNIDVDPFFVDPDGLDDVIGTEDDNLRLLPTSPCIDAGSHEVVSGATDMDGNPRFLDGDGDGEVIVDMGAYEFYATAFGSRLFVDADADGASDGTSWEDAYNDLQAALYIAAASPVVTEIWVAAGTYTPDRGTHERTATFQLTGGVALYGGFAGWETSLDQRDLDTNGTTLSGDLNGNDGPDFTSNGENSYHVLTSTDVGSNAVLDGFTISGGNANGGGPDSSGGGMYNEGGSLTTVSNCIFSGNAADADGGGMWNSGGDPVLINCIFNGNSATTGGGGAMWISEGNPVLINCVLSGNVAGTDGGGVYSESGSPMLTNCILWGNSDSGGADESAQIHGGTPVVNYSCIDDWTGSLGGVGNIGDDPFFVDPNGADDIAGTEDDDLRLSAGSPCIDSGSNGAVPADFLDLNSNSDLGEVWPFDLDGNPRFFDDLGTDDVGSGYPPIVDMGSYEYRGTLTECIAGELEPPLLPLELGYRVDYEEMERAMEVDLQEVIDPPTAAFYHAAERKFFANEGGRFVTIYWIFRGQSGVMVSDKRYGIKDAKECVAASTNGYEVARTHYFQAYPDANVFISELYRNAVTIRYNSTITENLPEGEGAPALNPDIRIVTGGQVQVDENCPEGTVVLQYDEELGGRLVGFEVLTITRVPAQWFPGVYVGRPLSAPDPDGCDECQDCRAVVIQNIERDGFPVAWQRGEDTTDIYPIRPEDEMRRLIVAWYKNTPLGNCWPVAVRTYTTVWPDDSQVYVIDEEATAGSIPAGSLVDLRSDLYCGAGVMYQAPLPEDEGEPGADIPYAHVTAAGEFAARRPGYSVLRLDIQPDETSDCGDEVRFEVVRSVDHHEEPVFSGEGNWWIGSQIEARYCLDGNSNGLICFGDEDCPTDGECVDWICDAGENEGEFCDTDDDCGSNGVCSRPIHDTGTPQFTYGYVYSGRPYAVEIYEETGQIIPVNVSTNSTGGGHGPLEVWWYEEGSYAEGIYWPYKVASYDCQWPDPDHPGDPIDDPIVIAARTGAGSYPADATVYDVGNADDEETLAGWNPNDEHAVLLPVGEGGSLVAFAVRDDDPWRSRWGVETGHPYVLVQYPDLDLWKMGVHQVVSTNGTDNFYYDYGSNGVFVGLPIDPLFPVNYAAALCEDTDPDDGRIMQTYVEPGALWVDNKLGVWAIAGPDENGEPRRSNVYIWENWAADGGCQPWLANGPGGCCLYNSCTSNGYCIDSNTDGVYESPWPVTYEPCWPEHEGQGCIYPDDPTCAPLFHIGETIDRSGQCGSIEILHNDANARVIDPTREVSVEYELPGEIDFAKLPPHLYRGEIGGGGEWPDRVRYDQAEVRLYFRGVMSGRDKDFLLSLPPETIDTDDLDKYNTAVAQLYTLSHVQIDGPFVCVGGRDAGDDCHSNSDCLEGRCVAMVCDGGEFVGQGCTDDSQCEPDGACIDLTPTDEKFVSVAHPGANEGWVTLGLQNDKECTDAGLPVSVEVWRVECPPYQGYIRPIQPQCPFSEKLVLQFSGDGGGDLSNLYFQWQVSTNYDSSNPGVAFWDNYKPPGTYVDGHALREVVIEGAYEFTLKDSYWRVRYRGYNGCPCSYASNCGTNENPPCCPDLGEKPDEWAPRLGCGVCVDNWCVGGPSDGGSCESDDDCLDATNTAVSQWTDVQLAEGWIKRVVRGLNPFDQRIEDFHVNEAATYVDMIRQAGKRFEDIVALNCDAESINNLGLIEVYEGVLRRAKQFSIDKPTATFLGTNGFQAIQLAAGKISDLYMLLGNEAFADAEDPTIGLFADQGEPSGAYDPHAMFCFEDQVPAVLDEELALLRGLDRVRSLDYDADGRLIATVYNRLPWNFTSDSGQVAYANNYQVTDVTEAMTIYPQGHGDAWGHYLTALKKFYTLLRHPSFDWVVATEDVLVAGQIVPVGYKYERKFAHAAAAKARTGAAVTSLTFRQAYTADPAQQMGHPDSDSDRDRAWGVVDWGRRAGQGAYFDWVMANALLPSEDTTHEGIQKIDRGTVPELHEIAASYTEIQTIVDKADAGLNPVGLAANVVPFGLNPSDLEEGKTHFDQVFERALVALNNASTAFDYANQNTQRLRSMQDNVDRFDEMVEERELDYKGRLVEIFGRPYPEDVGVGGTYPAGYDGPDIFHFAYVDPTALIAQDNSRRTTTISANFDVPNLSGTGAEQEAEAWVVDFNVSVDGLGLVKPSGWGDRPEPGEIQFARAELLQAIGRYMQALERYESLLDQIEDQADLLRSLYKLNDDVLSVMYAGRDKQIRLNALIAGARTQQLVFRRMGSIAVIYANALAEALPTALGLSNDVTAPARSAIRLYGSTVSEILNAEADIASLNELQRQQDKEVVSTSQQITITGLQNEYQEKQQVVALKQLIRSLPASRLELYALAEAIQQAVGRHDSAIGRGLRLWEQRTTFRQRTAEQISEYRYRDIAFRIFRNDALQKYRGQFDLAARYVYLAAQTYDYETNLLGTDPLSGQRFLTDIVKERSLGVIAGGMPYVGNGLAGKLAEMGANFEVARSELGFNSKDELTRTFSLRWETDPRVPNVFASDGAWQSKLSGWRVDDLTELDVYRHYCQPLAYPTDTASTNGREPAIVIPFSTTVTSGLNLFGLPSQGDETLPPDRYAVKIHSVGVRFTQSYASPPLNKHVNVYLVPAGTDIMRVPTDGSIREWQVLDQTLPLPFPISQNELAKPDWTPWDSVVGGSAAAAHRRRIPTITACPATDEECDLSYKLTGRSIWNTQWYLIIPGSQLRGDDPEAGLDWFINGEYGTGVRDIKLTLKCYGYTGNVQVNLSAPGSDE